MRIARAVPYIILIPFRASTDSLAIWIILALYLFSIHSRENKLRKEIQGLK
jgi:hypothetical protein